jgi:hypothetical protein
MEMDDLNKRAIVNGTPGMRKSAVSMRARTTAGRGWVERLTSAPGLERNAGRPWSNPCQGRDVRERLLVLRAFVGLVNLAPSVRMRRFHDRFAQLLGGSV